VKKRNLRRFAGAVDSFDYKQFAGKRVFGVATHEACP
jgi:hypothetical protein